MSKSKIILKVAVFLFTIAVVPSAVANQWGVQAGGSFRSFSKGKAVVTPSDSSELLLGVFYEKGMDGPLSLQPELLFRGAFDEGNWIVLPLLAKWKFFPTPGVKPYVFAGPELSFGSYKNSSETIGFALSAGGGVEFPLRPTLNLLLSGRYVLGLSDVGTPASGGVESRHVYLMAGVGFPL